MTEYITDVKVKTLGEYIKSEYPDFEIDKRGGEAPLDMDVSHGVAVDVYDNRKHGYDLRVVIHPFIKWTDGLWKPCFFGWGMDKSIELVKR